MDLVDSDQLHAAAEVVAGRVRRTPVLAAERLDDVAGRPVLAKAEALQVTGSFKVRGALNRIVTLTQQQRDAGLITISAGNAALGAAHAAREVGAELVVVMPENAVVEKLEAVRRYGATVVNQGITSAAVAFERAAELQADRGLTLVHPFDDPMVIAGAGTATLELLQDHPEIRQLFVPCSGGGLLAGAVAAVRALEAPVEVIGVQPEGNDGFVRSLAAGSCLGPPTVATVADGLTAPRPGELNFRLVRDAGVRIVTVPDAEILEALALITRTLRVVVEPAGATALAGLLRTPSDATSAVMLSGSNVNWRLLADQLVNGVAP